MTGKNKFKMLKKISAFLCAGLLLVSSVPKASAEDHSTQELLGYAKDIISWEKAELGIPDGDSLFSGDFLENAGLETADWFVIGASRLGLEEDYKAYLSALEENVCERYRSDEKLDSVKATEWHRIILAVLSCGGEPVDFGGTDLVEDGVYGRGDAVGNQGVNGWIWSLTAVDSLCWKIPEDSQVDRNYIIEKILSQQREDGGFSISGDSGDCDLTAMAVQALSPYYNDGAQDRVRNALDKALGFLSENQQDNGDFGSCEATAQVLCALCDMGINFQTDERFIKSQDAFEALLDYRNSDGGFAHMLDGGSESMSSAQALLAVAAVTRYENTMRRIYDFRQEFSVLDREKLDAVNGQLSRLPENEDNKDHCNSLYWQLPADLQSYVYSYRYLLDLQEKYGLSLSDKDFTAEMNLNESGCGYIYSVEKTEEFTFKEAFTEADMQEYERLMTEGVSGSDKTLCASLIGKLEASENVTDKEKILEDLNEMKLRAEEIYEEINDINAEIMDGLYPFEELDDEQLRRLQEIYARTEKLSEKDKQKITGFEELTAAYEKSVKPRLLPYVIFAAAAAAVCIVLILHLHRKKRDLEEK